MDCCGGLSLHPLICPVFSVEGNTQKIEGQKLASLNAQGSSPWRA